MLVVVQELTVIMGILQPLLQVVRLSLLLTVGAVVREATKVMLGAQGEEVAELEE